MVDKENKNIASSARLDALAEGELSGEEYRSALEVYSEEEIDARAQTLSFLSAGIKDSVESLAAEREPISVWESINPEAEKSSRSYTFVPETRANIWDAISDFVFGPQAVRVLGTAAVAFLAFNLTTDGSFFAEDNFSQVAPEKPVVLAAAGETRTAAEILGTAAPSAAAISNAAINSPVRMVGLDTPSRRPVWNRAQRAELARRRNFTPTTREEVARERRLLLAKARRSSRAPKMKLGDRVLRISPHGLRFGDTRIDTLRARGDVSVLPTVNEPPIIWVNNDQVR